MVHQIRFESLKFNARPDWDHPSPNYFGLDQEHLFQDWCRRELITPTRGSITVVDTTVTDEPYTRELNNQPVESAWVTRYKLSTDGSAAYARTRQRSQSAWENFVLYHRPHHYTPFKIWR